MASFSSLLSFIFYFLKKKPLTFVFLTIAPISIILEANIIPYAFKILIDSLLDHSINKNEVINKISPALLLGGGSWICFIVVIRFQQSLQAATIPNFEADIRFFVLDYITQHSYNYFADKMPGSIGKNLDDIVRAIESIRNIVTWQIIPCFAVVICTLVLNLYLDPLFSYLLGGWVVIHVILSFCFAKYVNIASKENAKDKSVLNGHIVDTISNIITVHLSSRRQNELNYLLEIQSKEKESNKNLIKTTNLYQIALDVPLTLMILFVVYFLVVRWRSEVISTGSLVFIFNSTFAVIFQIWSLGNIIANLANNIGIARQALTLISEPHEITSPLNAKNLLVMKGEIKFENVSFAYPNGNTVFDGLNLEILPGQKVGIIGFSGSGKSTFLKLILRLFEVKSGSIIIDGQNINSVNLESLRNNITIIPQDLSLFCRSIKDNISYGKIDASEEEIITASKRAQCHEFIKNFPHQYNSLVGDRGFLLSEGQRQRIKIARAILKASPLVLMDEATSSLDSDTEKFVQESLETIMKDKTSIVVAHRLSTIANMDRIIIFDKGKVVGDGSHEELLSISSYYQRIFKMQFAGD